MSDAYIIYGARASYFTQKMLGIFRYKEIPHEYRKKTLAISAEIEKAAGSRLIPVVRTPEGDYLFDTTPIAFELDRHHPGSDLLPRDPVPRITARILEDFFDEWFTRFVLSFRWFYAEDCEHSADSITRDLIDVEPDATLTPEEKALYNNARSTLVAWAKNTAEKVGAGELDTPHCLAEFEGHIAHLEVHFQAHDYFLGERPSLPDFTLYGALEAHLLFDPTPKAILHDHAPALVKFHERMHNARAGDHERRWPEAGAMPETLKPVLREISTRFHPFLNKNKEAVRAGEKTVLLDIGYGEREFAARRYMEKCRLEIAEEIAALPAGSRAAVEDTLDPLGCWRAYKISGPDKS